MSFLDPVKPSLNPVLFNGLKFKPEVFGYIKKRLYSIIPKSKVSRMFLLGSSAGYQYNEYSDVDVNVILVPGEKREYWHKIVKKYNEIPISGTEHPLNFFVQEYQETFKFEDAKYPIYDLTNDRWEVKPTKVDYIPTEKFSREIWYANKIIKSYINQVNILKRNRQELKNIVNNPEKYKNKLKEIEKNIEALVGFHRKLDKDRKDAYYGGWGVPRDSQQNIIYKLVEYHKIHKLLKILDKVFGDRNVNEP